MQILDDLLSATPSAEPLADAEAWWARHQAVAGTGTPFDRAARAGLHADRPGFAFASGYTEALRHLVPSLGDAAAALCVTEEGGNHPRAIETRLDPDADGWRMTGEKSFVTLCGLASTLLVLASTGTRDGRKELAVVRVPANREGVRIATRPPLPFVPEIPHGRVFLDGVRVERTECLSTRAWVELVRPFRTVEDLHVFGALLAWCVRAGRIAGWSTDVLGALIVRVAATRALALADPSAPGVQIATSSLVRDATDAADGLDWAACSEEVRTRWTRTRPLLEVARSARKLRRERAWSRLAAAGSGG